MKTGARPRRTRRLIAFASLVSAMMPPATHAGDHRPTITPLPACAPQPAVRVKMASSSSEVVTTIVRLGTAVPTDGGDVREEGEAGCGSETPATYVVTTLPSRGTLLDAHTLARISVVPHVLAREVSEGTTSRSRSDHAGLGGGDDGGWRPPLGLSFVPRASLGSKCD